MGNENGSLEGLPNKTKHCGHIDVNNDYTVGYCSMQGWRRTMEDAILISKIKNNPNVSGLYGVFDGHGGSIVSHFVAINLKTVITNTESFTNEEYEKAIAESFLKFDKLLDSKIINDFLLQSNSEYSVNENINNSNESDGNSIKLESNGKHILLTKQKFDEITSLNEENKVEIYKEKIQDHEKEKKEGKYIIELLDCQNSENEDNNDNNDNNDNDIEIKPQTTLDKKEEEDKKNDNNDNLTEKCFYENFELDKKVTIHKNESDNKFNDNKDKNNANEESNYKIAYEMGTTGNLILLKKNRNDFTVYIANTGDSISYMYRNGKAIKLNKEHKVIRNKEKNRINKISKDIITNDRVGGKLNLSRAIGDLHFKKYVISLPEITIIDSTEGIDFIIIGCDGFWDSVEPLNVCEYIKRKLKNDKESDCANSNKNNKADNNNKNKIEVKEDKVTDGADSYKNNKPDNNNNKNKIEDILPKLFDGLVPETNSGHVGTDNISVIILIFNNEKNNPKNSENKENSLKD